MAKKKMTPCAFRLVLLFHHAIYAPTRLLQRKIKARFTSQRTTCSHAEIVQERCFVTALGGAKRYLLVGLTHKVSMNLPSASFSDELSGGSHTAVAQEAGVRVPSDTKHHQVFSRSYPSRFCEWRHPNVPDAFLNPTAYNFCNLGSLSAISETKR